MKRRTSKFVLLLWLASCNLAIEPIVAWCVWNNEIDAREGLSRDLETLKKYAEKVSTKRENLELGYKDWLPVTAETLEHLNRARNEIIRATKTDNSITLTSAAFVGITAVASVLTGGVSLLAVTVPATGIGAIGVQYLSGSSRYLVSNITCDVALSSLNRSKEYTKRLFQKMDSYFDAMARFKEFHAGIRGSDSNVYRIVRSERFLEDLKIDKKTQKELRDLFLQIIDYDVSKIEPHIPILDAIESLIRGAQSLASDAKRKLNEMKETFESALGAFSIIKGDINRIEANDLLDVSSLGDFSQLPDDTVPQTLGTVSFGLKELITSLVLVEQALVAAMAAKNLAEGSKSVESEEILKAMDKLADVRETVAGKMKVNFGW